MYHERKKKKKYIYIYIWASKIWGIWWTQDNFWSIKINIARNRDGQNIPRMCYSICFLFYKI